MASPRECLKVKHLFKGCQGSPGEVLCGRDTEGEGSKCYCYSLGSWKNSSPWKPGSSTGVGMGFLSEPRRKIPWSLTILKGYSLGSTAVPRIFFTLRVRTGRSLSCVTFRIKTPASRNSSMPFVRSLFARCGRCEVMTFVVARLD